VYSSKVLALYSSKVLALYSSKVLALYSFSRLIRVFANAKRACNYIVVRC
jgi:hypothetical protein